MEVKESYTLAELFDNLPITIAKLGRDGNISEVTLARIRDGARTRRDTVNKMLKAFSAVYERDLNLRNVTGINIMINLRKEKAEAKKKTA